MSTAGGARITRRRSPVMLMERTGLRPFLLGIVAVALAWLGQRSLPAGATFDAWLFFGAAVVLFLAAFWPARFDPLLPLPARCGGMRVAEAWSIRVAAGLITIALLLTLNAAQQFWDLEPFAPGAWWWHLAAIGSALGGAFLLDRGVCLRSPGEPSSAADLSTRQTLAWLALILGVAAFFRLFRFDSLPFGTWYDEAESGLQAMRILADANFRPIFDGATHGAAHYLYLVAGAFKLAGIETQSIRLVSVGMGLLAVVAAYLAGDELFGRRMGLVAAFLVAVSSWAVTLSRFGMYATMSTPLFALLSVAFAAALAAHAAHGGLCADRAVGGAGSLLLYVVPPLCAGAGSLLRLLGRARTAAHCAPGRRRPSGSGWRSWPRWWASSLRRWPFSPSSTRISSGRASRRPSSWPTRP